MWIISPIVAIGLLASGVLHHRASIHDCSKKYDWLNQIQAVGKMVSIQRGVKIKYDWFIVR